MIDELRSTLGSLFDEKFGVTHITTLCDRLLNDSRMNDVLERARQAPAEFLAQCRNHFPTEGSQAFDCLEVLAILNQAQYQVVKGQRPPCEICSTQFSGRAAEGICNDCGAFLCERCKAECCLTILCESCRAYHQTTLEHWPNGGLVADRSN